MRGRFGPREAAVRLALPPDRARRSTVLAGSPARSEPKDPCDAFSYEVVVPTPKESSLRVKKDVVFARGNRGPLKLDVYLPRTGARPPAVVFANVVGERGSRPFRVTEIYRSWARLQARSELGRMLLVSGDRAGAIEEYDTLVARSEVPERTRSTALYNLACAHALEGHKEAALGRLEEAAAAGFRNANEISADPSREPPADPRYRALIERLGGASAGDPRR